MKKFVLSFTISLLVGLLLVGAYIVITDPFYYYHKPFFGAEAYMDNALYQTPGAAKNFQYDAVIVGSSMTENFRESWFEEMGLNVQKLSYSGAEIKDYERIYDIVFGSGNNVGLVITDLNGFQFASPVDAIYHEYPEYLYSRYAPTDVKYLYNNDVFWEACGRKIEEIGFGRLKKDDSYTWEEETLFSEERARYDYTLFKDSLDESIAQGSYSKATDEERMQIAQDNIALLEDIIKRYSETLFVFYLPAYSNLYWQEVIDEDDLDLMLDMYTMIVCELSGFDNVLMFDFQDDLELINDLNRYRDVCHHDPLGNRFVYECIRDTILKTGEHQNEYLVDVMNIEEHINRVRENTNCTP